MAEQTPLLAVDAIEVHFTKGRQTVQAVAGVTFEVSEGETLGLVGESGCGKSTTGRAIVQVNPPSKGTVVFDGKDLSTLSRKELREARVGIQMIFQDPISSLNPRRKVRDIVREPLDIWNRGTEEERTAKVDEMLRAVGIDPDLSGDRYPREFSSASASPLPAHSSWSPRSSSATRWSRPSMFRCRPRSSTS